MTPTADAVTACNAAFYSDVMTQALVASENHDTFNTQLERCIETVSRTSDEARAIDFAVQYLQVSGVTVNSDGSVSTPDSDVSTTDDANVPASSDL